MANVKIFINRGVLIKGLHTLLKDDATFYRTFRQYHLHSFKSNTSLYRNLCHVNLKNLQRPCLVGVRFNSTDLTPPNTVSTVDVLSDLPAIPAAPEPLPVVPIEEIAQQSLNVLGEPTLTSLGLANWTPAGVIQSSLEFFHVSLHMPWWASIMLGTLILRTLMFPLVVMSQRNAAKLNNNLPQMQLLQLKMTEARQSGNKLEAARLAQEMMVFMKEKGMNPLINMIPPLAQAPVFISMFIGLRGMCNLPVDSLRTGGMYWFQDLTVPDQFFLLPVMTSITLFITIECGVDSARASTLGYMRYVFRALPLVILPFTVNFPGAVLCYWLSSNVISLGQVSLLRVPRFRAYFNIEQLIVHPTENLPMKQKGFVKGVKESITNLKITNELQAREYADELSFQRAGKDPIRRTFKHDPTKIAPRTIEAKKQS